MKTKKILVLATLLTVSASVFAQKTGRVIIPEKNLKFKANDDFTEVTITDFVYDSYEESRKFDGKFLEVPSKIQGVPVTAIESDYDDRSVFGSSSTREIEGLYIPDCVKTIGSHAFESSGFKTIRLPMGLKEIPRFCFDSCFAEDIEIPESVEEIGQEAFKNAYIKTVKLPAGVLIAGDAFNGCKVQTLVFPEGRIYFSSVGNGPFNYCDNLEKLVIPQDFEVIIDDGTRETLTTYDINGEKINASFALQKQIKSVKVRYRGEVEAEEKIPVYQEEYNSLYKAGNYKEAIEKAKAAQKLAYFQTADDVKHWSTLLLNAQLEEYFLPANVKELEAKGSVLETDKVFVFRIPLEHYQSYPTKEFRLSDSLDNSFRVDEDIFLEHLNKATGKEYKIKEFRSSKYYLCRELTKEELSVAKKAQKKDKLKSYKDSFIKMLKD